MLEAGEASVEAIDQAMREAGFPMGPFELMDLVGVDVNLAAAAASGTASVGRTASGHRRSRSGSSRQGAWGASRARGFYRLRGRAAGRRRRRIPGRAGEPGLPPPTAIRDGSSRPSRRRPHVLAMTASPSEADIERRSGWAPATPGARSKRPSGGRLTVRPPSRVRRVRTAADPTGERGRHALTGGSRVEHVADDRRPGRGPRCGCGGGSTRRSASLPSSGNVTWNTDRPEPATTRPWPGTVTTGCCRSRGRAAVAHG